MQALLDSYEEALTIWQQRFDELNASLITADLEADLEPSAEHEKALYEARAAVASWVGVRTTMMKKRRDLLTYLEATAEAARFVAARSESELPASSL